MTLDNYPEADPFLPESSPEFEAMVQAVHCSATFAVEAVTKESRRKDINDPIFPSATLRESTRIRSLGVMRHRQLEDWQ